MVRDSWERLATVRNGTARDGSARLVTMRKSSGWPYLTAEPLTLGMLKTAHRMFDSYDTLLVALEGLTSLKLSKAFPGLSKT